MTKKEYETPEIKELGNLTDITRGSWSGEPNEDKDYTEAHYNEIYGFVS